MAPLPLPPGSIRVVGSTPTREGRLYTVCLGEPATALRERTGVPHPEPLLVQAAPGVSPPELAGYEETARQVEAALARYTAPHPVPGFSGHPAPVIMGVLNVTPDSFSDGGRWCDPEAAVAAGAAMVEAGADLLDVGGESTRPGAEPVSAAEETRRTVPVIQALRRRLDTPVSIDTRKAAVAREALEAGAAWVNDISALGDPAMGALVAERGCPLVLMHMRGEPRTMQQGVAYTDPVAEIHTWLRDRVALALQAGVAEDTLLLDPGIGFGKRLEDNLAIMRRLDEFRTLGLPLLIGTSRKSFIGHTLDREVGERVHGTGATVAAAVLAGARVIRVHDVEAMRDVARMAAAIRDGAEVVRDEREQGAQQD